MSEYHFDYKIVSRTGYREKRIKLFFARSYDTLGMQIQVCVPEEIYRNFRSIRLRYAHNASARPATLLSSLGQEALNLITEERLPIFRDRSDPDATFVSDINGFYIKAREGSFACTGELGFCKSLDPDAVPLEEDIYEFVVNFARKETIHYKIREINRDGTNHDRLEISVLYPRLYDDIELRLYSKATTKPILRGDFDSSKEVPLKRKLTLRKFRRDESLSIFVVAPGEDVFTHNYRLGFADGEKLEPFYFLSDDSEFTSEDQTRRQQEKENEERRSKQTPVVLCPYCGNPVSPVALKARKGVWGCDGEHFYKNVPASRFRIAPKKTIVCNQKPHLLSHGAIPLEHPILPVNYGEHPVANLVVAGAPKCGKTTFLASLFDVRKDEDIYVSHPAILQEILRHFLPKRKNRSVREVKMDGAVLPASGPIGLDGSYEEARSKSLTSSSHPGHKVGVKGRYAFDVNSNFESNTQALDEAVLSFNPIGFELGEAGHAYFYDVPGEMFDMDNPSPVRCLDVANGLIVLVDGDPEVGIDEDLEVGRILSRALAETNLDPELRKAFLEYMQEDDPDKKRDLAKGFMPLLGGLDPSIRQDLEEYKDHLLLPPTPGTKKSPLRKLGKTFANLRKLRTNGEPLSSLPIAIVFSKLDARLYGHEGSRADADAFCFDANTHITHENMVPLYPASRRYRHSELERHINNASYEIEEYLRSWPDGASVIDNIRAECGNVKFFACSALGGADVLRLGSTTSVKRIMYRPRPIRMELPIVWLFYQLGVIS